MQNQRNRETEIKLELTNGLAEILTRLEGLGFQIAAERVFESNVVLDTPDQNLRSHSELLRIRRVGRRGILTYKGVPDEGKHKSREEIEVSVPDPDNLELIFLRLGYAPSFRYEKYRTEYQRAGEPGIVTVDETPIGKFLELEGDPAWIDKTAALLGFSEMQFITKSYGRLYQDFRAATGTDAPDMVFVDDGLHIVEGEQE